MVYRPDPDRYPHKPDSTRQYESIRLSEFVRLREHTWCTVSARLWPPWRPRWPVHHNPPADRSARSASCPPNAGTRVACTAWCGTPPGQGLRAGVAPVRTRSHRSLASACPCRLSPLPGPSTAAPRGHSRGGGVVCSRCRGPPSVRDASPRQRALDCQRRSAQGNLAPGPATRVGRNGTTIQGCALPG